MSAKQVIIKELLRLVAITSIEELQQREIKVKTSNGYEVVLKFTENGEKEGLRLVKNES